MSQRELARLAGTSAPTIAMYESGQKEPRFSTLARLVAATGANLNLVVTHSGEAMSPELTREERRSLALNRKVVEKLLGNPGEVLALARKNLDLMRSQNDGSAEPWFEKWDHLLNGPLELIVAVLGNPAHEAAALRQVSPFAGVLSPPERWETYREFRASEARRAS